MTVKHEALIFADVRLRSHGEDIYEWAIDADVWIRRLHAENETLRTGYAAARLEIESLQLEIESLQLQLIDQGRVIEKVMHALPDEQVAFERHYRHLDLSRERDAWGNLRYTHDAVSLAWESWQVRASHGQAPVSKIMGLTAAQESLGVEFEKVLHDNLFDLYEESPQARTAVD